MINVTRTELPNRSKFNKYLDEIWKSNWITNDGKYVQLLEKKLQKYLNVENLLVVANGTLALQLAFKALGLRGEVITTPFTFTATTNSLIWEGLKPVFADIDPDTFNIDPQDVKRKITKNTSAILAVHIYGNPCSLEKLAKIASENNLKLIYDAAHAFGVKYKHTSVLSFGDISTLSFHATKTFHTIEGGAIIVKDKRIYEELRLYRNFGIKSEEEILLPGINAKMNEFQAIMGLTNLPNLKNSSLKRGKIYKLYKDGLSVSKKIKFQEIFSSDYNYAYMPVVFENRKVRDRIYEQLVAVGIKPRKYFYPLLSNIDYIKKRSKITKLTNSQIISDSILCLPIYAGLDKKDVKKIIKIINLNI